MRLRTLGGLALDGARLTRPKPLLLLAYLAFEGARERRHVADLFWPGARDPLKSLTVALSQIRRAAPGAVDADRRRVWTRVPCDASDLLVRLQRGDLRVVEAGVPGAFLDGADVARLGVELEEWVFATREYLAGRVHRAQLELAEGLAGRGDVAAAVAHAERAVDWLGAAPEPDDLVRLHTVLLAGRSPLTALVRAEAAPYGVELAPTAAEAQARLRRRDVHTPGTLRPLPRRATTFVGREAELRDLVRLLARRGNPIVTLVGPAGVGKSRLALEAAHELARRRAFEGGIAFVPLAPLRSAPPDPEPPDPDAPNPDAPDPDPPDRDALDPDPPDPDPPDPDPPDLERAIPVAILQALGLRADGVVQPLQAVAEAIGQRSMLLLCDGFEHLMGGARHVAELVAACPNLRLLATSRERLRIAGERTLAVAGLPYPDLGDADAAGVRRAAAVRLFFERARRVRHGFMADDEALPHVLRICRSVEGLPLAIELAAAWIRVMPPRAIADSIERDLDLLRSRERDAPPGHQSMSAAFERSWSLLTPHEQGVLRRLAVFRGGFRREAAGAVAGANLATLTSLVDKSLLRVDDRGRFERQSLLYHYTRQKLNERPAEAEEAAGRHAAYYLALLRDAGDALRSARPWEALTHLEEEQENLLAAFAVADASQHRDAYAAAVVQLRRALAGLRAKGDTRGEARLLSDLGRLHFDAGELAAAQRVWEAGLTLSRRSEQLRDALTLATQLGRLHAAAGRHAEARDHAEQALEAARSVGDPSAEAAAWERLAATDLAEGHLADAERAARRAIGVAWRSGDVVQALAGLLLFADACALRGDAEGALGIYAAVQADDHAPPDVRGRAGAAFRRAAEAASADVERAARERASASDLGALVAKIVGAAGG
jgi:predicted ATPase